MKYKWNKGTEIEGMHFPSATTIKGLKGMLLEAQKARNHWEKLPDATFHGDKVPQRTIDWVQNRFYESERFFEEFDCYIDELMFQLTEEVEDEG